MRWLNNIKTGNKLIGSFVLVALFLVVLGLLAYFNMKSINDGMTSLYFDHTLPIQQVSRIKADIMQIRGDLYRFVYMPDDRAASKESVLTLEQDIKGQMDLYRATQLTKEEQTTLAEFDLTYAAYQQAAQQAISDVEAGKQDEAIKSMLAGGDLLIDRKAVVAAIDKLIEINATIADEIKIQGDVTFASAVCSLIIITIIAFFLAIGLGILISTTITSPLGIMAASLQNIGKGNLNRDMLQKKKDSISQRKDEFGTAGKGLAQTEIYLQAMAKTADILASGDLTVSVTPKSEKDELSIAFAKMIATLRSSVSQIAENADSLGTASNQLASAANQAGQATSQISATVQQVAKGITQETQAITQTANSIEQMTRAIDGVARGAQDQTTAVNKASEITNEISNTIQQVAGNAQSVTKNSADAAEASRAGAKAAADTVSGMEKIKAKVSLSAQKVAEMGARSGEIGSIVATIEDIASQTNLLALNAAIEAARAGEHGKGFAVVADEVRKLAERSSSATKEIGGLIKGIQKTVSEAVKAMEEGGKEVENGVELANAAGNALVAILKAAEVVYQQAGEAARSTQSMSEAASQLVTSVDSVSAVVEENTAATEEISAGTAEVTQAIESIASVSEENSAAIEEVSASTEEMTAQVEEVGSSAQSLAAMAKVLQDVVNQFKL